jgi:Thiolase-like protein type 1 additional C-terminal domain
VAGSYSAAAIGGGPASGAGGAPPEAGAPWAGVEPGASCGISCPDRVAFGSPFQLKPSLSGVGEVDWSGVGSVESWTTPFTRDGEAEKSFLAVRTPAGVESDFAGDPGEPRPGSRLCSRRGWPVCALWPWDADPQPADVVCFRSGVYPELLTRNIHPRA